MKKALFSIGSAAIGNDSKLKTEDPYAVDSRYLKYLFDLGNVRPMPRNLTQPMAYFAKRLSYNIISSSTGRVNIACVPSQCFNANPVTNLTPLLPFLCLKNGNDDNFYAGGVFQTPPFLAQATQIIGFALDKVAFSFVSTQSPLNVQGKITTALYQ